MIILGVDPGSNVTGYGVIRKDRSRVHYVAGGTIRVSASLSQSKRIWKIYQALEETARTYSPSVLVVESLFHSVNPQSLMKLCQVRGAVLLLGESRGMDVYEYSPMEIKKGLTGYGRAEKDQMKFMVAKVLGLPKLTSADEADALAMAIFHSHMILPSEVAV